MAFTTSTTTAAAPAKPAPVVATVAAPAAPAPVVLENHPAIHHAIEALEAAKNDLRGARHDFGGHRDKAIEAIDHALEQLREAERYDR